MGRRPFPVDIDGRVVVPAMDSATRTRPHAVSEGNEGIEVATDMTQFRTGKPGINMLYQRASFIGDVMENSDIAGKTQIGDFATPQRLHATQVQRFQADDVIGLTQLASFSPVEGFPHMGYAAMETGQMGLGFGPIVRTLDFP